MLSSEVSVCAHAWIYSTIYGYRYSHDEMCDYIRSLVPRPLELGTRLQILLRVVGGDCVTMVTNVTSHAA